MRTICLIVLSIVLGMSMPVFADSEAPNSTYVKASEYGQVYAKSIPEEEDWDDRTKGKTFVYGVTDKEDKLLYAFDWYANQIYLLDNMPSVVRLGPWARGHEPKEEDLSIGFYINGKKLKEYSTLDIVNMAYDDPMNIGGSVSHYDIFSEIVGYRYVRADKWVFDVKTHEDKILSFDVSTGVLRTEEEENLDALLGKIDDMKIGCYEESSKRANEDEYKHFLTEESFKDCVGDDMPQIPEGYNLYLGMFFDEVKLEKVE